MAGVEGVEPSHTVPETAVLPLDDTPSATRCASCSVNYKVQARVSILRGDKLFVKSLPRFFLKNLKLLGNRSVSLTFESILEPNGDMHGIAEGFVV